MRIGVTGFEVMSNLFSEKDLAAVLAGGDSVVNCSSARCIAIRFALKSRPQRSLNLFAVACAQLFRQSVAIHLQIILTLLLTCGDENIFTV